MGVGRWINEDSQLAIINDGYRMFYFFEHFKSRINCSKVNPTITDSQVAVLLTKNMDTASLIRIGNLSCFCP